MARESRLGGRDHGERYVVSWNDAAFIHVGRFTANFSSICITSADPPPAHLLEFQA